MSVNNSNTRLVEGKDFTIEHTGGSGAFSQYIYTINSTAFRQKDDKLLEGSYTIVLDSVDSAGNLNSNRDNEMNAPINFTLDETRPIITINGLDETRIQEESRTVNVIFWDGTAVSKVEIYLNNELFKTLEGEELLEIGDNYTFDVMQANYYQTVSVKAYDVAGNVAEEESNRVFINSSVVRQFFHNPLLLGISAAILLGGGSGIIYIVSVRKKKKEATAA